MAYEISTATDHVDLYNKLIAFITGASGAFESSNSAEVPQQWEIVWEGAFHHESNSNADYADVVVRGPGLSASEQIYVGIALRNIDVGNDSAEIHLLGMTGIIPSAQYFDEHVNVQPNVSRILVRASAMNYWFTANGRRFAGVVGVSTVYESFYAGFFLPYATPLQYSYPMFIGGSAGPVGDASGASFVTDWRSVTDGHHSYACSVHKDSNTDAFHSGAMMLSPAGEWLSSATGFGSGSNPPDTALGPRYFFRDFEDDVDKVTISQGGTGYGYLSVMNRIVQCFDDTMSMTPITITRQLPEDATYGVLDGIYHVPGRGNSSENIVQFEGEDYIVFQDVFRTAIGAYNAMVLGVP